MKAIVYDHYGDPDVLHLTDWPAPQAGVGEVVIDVAAVAVAPGDCKTRAGVLHHFHPQTFPKIPGRSGVGRISARHADLPPPEVDAPGLGDMVFFSTPHTGQGCSAEQIASDVTSLAKVPAGLDPVDVAAIAHSAVCAWRGLVDHAALRSGQSVLIVGGSGVVGLVAIELAVHLGARVTATGSQRRADDMVRAGAEAIWAPEKLAAVGDDPTQAPRFDCVFDLIGGATHAQASRLLKPGGAIVYLRAEALPDGCADGEFALPGEGAEDGGVGRRAVVDVNYTPAVVTRVLGLVAQRVLTPRVALAVPLHECAQAHRRVEAGRLDGRVVLRLQD